MHFHPLKSDYLIWSGSKNCESFTDPCHVEAFYTLDNGRSWERIDEYMRNCAWARDSELLIDPNQILCESYKIKEGNQRYFGMDNPLELVGGTDFYSQTTKLFDHVVGFAKFSEFLIVAEVSFCICYVYLNVKCIFTSIKLRVNRSIFKYLWMGGLSLQDYSRRPCALINT